MHVNADTCEAARIGEHAAGPSKGSCVHDRRCEHLRVELVWRDALPEQAGAPLQLLRPHQLLLGHGLRRKLVHHYRHDHVCV